MPTLDNSNRLTRRRSSAGPVPPQRPQQPRFRQRESNTAYRDASPAAQSSHRPTYLALRDHGKVYVADLPRLSDGQLIHITKEAQDVLESLNRRLQELNDQISLNQVEQDTKIRATTKRDVTERFLQSIAQEQELRLRNPALRAAAGESLARAFLELSRHRLPGSTFDSILQEALTACSPGTDGHSGSVANDPQLMRLIRKTEPPHPRSEALPVVITSTTPTTS